MRTIPNKSIISLDKVSFCFPLLWRDQTNVHCRDYCPTDKTIFGTDIDWNTTMPATQDFPSESMHDRLKRRGDLIFDTWTPYLLVVMSNGREIEFSGNKALTLNALWKLKMLGRKHKRYAHKTNSRNQREFIWT